MQLHKRERNYVKNVKIMSELIESNSSFILCLLDWAALVIFIWSPGWTAEDQYALSHFISYLVAALSAEVYIRKMEKKIPNEWMVGQKSFSAAKVKRNPKNIERYWRKSLTSEW
jgi:hypothetical protein